MSVIHIGGFRRLCGRIPVQGSKNGVLPLMAASVLSEETTVLTNVPAIQDVFCMMGILDFMGCSCLLENGELTISPRDMGRTDLPACRVKQMRSSVILLGALLGRFGQASTCYPGGCSIGKRPVDYHICALRQLGAEIEEEGGCIRAKAVRLSGTEIRLPYPSVGATENALLASVLAEGTTVIRGAAREPEIEELCLFLRTMGAGIEGEGTDRITVRGRKRLHGCRYRTVGDRIVAGTYLIAAMAGRGDVELTGVKPAHLESVFHMLRKAGAAVSPGEDRIRIRMEGRPRPLWAETGPYPGFPTDLQSPLMALLCCGEGESRIRETVFEGRYGTALELGRLGADISVAGEEAVIRGIPILPGGTAAARDLRGGAALVTAGLQSEGETIITDCFHIERGYEDICRDLRLAGADIRWLERKAKEKKE